MSEPAPGAAAAATGAANEDPALEAVPAVTSPPQIRRTRSHSGPEADAGAALGLDIGGTLAKFVVFNPSETTNQALRHIVATIQGEARYGTTGIRADDLSFYSPALRGTFHFIHFETRRMQQACELIKKMGLHSGIGMLYATGGGAQKYKQLFRTSLGIELQSRDELKTMVRALQFLVQELPDAVYMLRNVKFSSLTAEEKVPVSLKQSLFPFIFCNIGSGVSLVLVKSPREIERVSGTALGGSTFYGLCRLLTSANRYDGALDLAAEGDSRHVNMLVRDIYGGSYNKWGLDGDLTASFFGKICRKDEDNLREGISDADVARALVVMITQNISQIAFLNAKICNTHRVIFTGSFLRHNNIACQTLAYGMERWSKLHGSEIQPLFLKHEGCLGALGCFLDNLDLRFAGESPFLAPAAPAADLNLPQMRLDGGDAAGESKN